MPIFAAGRPSKDVLVLHHGLVPTIRPNSQISLVIFANKKKYLYVLYVPQSDTVWYLYNVLIIVVRSSPSSLNHRDSELDRDSYRQRCV